MGLSFQPGLELRGIFHLALPCVTLHIPERGTPSVVGAFPVSVLPKQSWTLQMRLQAMLWPGWIQQDYHCLKAEAGYLSHL